MKRLAALYVAGSFAACGGEASMNSSDWREVGAPSVRIGVVDGAPPYQLHQVRDVLRLSDGTLVVADGGSGELRFFDGDGRHVRSTGGSGDGPGEFRSLASVAAVGGDSLVALDGGIRRVSILDPAGAYVRSWTAESPGPAMFPARIFAAGDGTILIAWTRGHRPSDPPGLFRGSAPLVRYSADGDVLNVVTEVPGDEWYFSAEHRSLSDRPFGHRSHVAVGADGVHVGVGDAEVLVYDVSGELRRRIPVEPPAAVTADHVRAWGETRLAAVSDPAGRPAAQRLVAEMPFPETLPPYAGVFVDDEGALWTKAYAYPTGPMAQWQVRDNRGRITSTLSLPSGFTPAFASDGQLAGVLVDELGVETVVVYDVRQ